MENSLKLGDLTDPTAVERAMAEYDALGRDEFLRKYGYGPSHRYFVLRNGREYDSKAIAGVAVGLQYPERGPLQANQFSGGETTVRAALERLGFTVVEKTEMLAARGNLHNLLEGACELLQQRELDPQSFSMSALDEIVLHRLPTLLQNEVGSAFNVRGRTRIGTPADVPWVGIFSATKEASAQKGYYLVYLFAKDGSSVFLSLNQGTEHVKGGMEALLKRAIDLRRVAGPQTDLLTSIDLRSTNTRPRKYEAGSSYAVRYDKAFIPQDAALSADLSKMLALLRKVETSGLEWDPEREPLHLLFKWNADREPRTVELHRNIADREGSVWWGRFSSSPEPSISRTKLGQLQEQISQGIVTHAYIYRRHSVWRTTVEEATVEPPKSSDPLFPSYYKPEDCNFFVRLSDWKDLPPDWLRENVVLASHPDPDPDRMASALSNQTNPLFVFELGGPQAVIVVEEEEAEIDQIDISDVTLAEVCEDVASRLHEAGLDYGTRHDDLIRSALVSLATKRFLLLTGLSGSGKSRLGIAIGEWFGPDRLKVVAVRPDWTGPDAILGFENGLSPIREGRHAWTTPESLEYLLIAARDPRHPYLLLLDEMNLAHVERYFADVLSGMESERAVLPNVIRAGAEWRLTEPTKIPFPKNVFVVGTVNIDETTYMFSPKVLDRANTLEFRVMTGDLRPGIPSPAPVEAGPPTLVRRFLHAATTVVDEDWSGRSQLAEWFRELHESLSTYDREFGHRVFLEALRFAALLSEAGDPNPYSALDLQVLQKVLPRFHGSIREISDPLNALGAWCWFGPAHGAATPSFDPLSPPQGLPMLPLSFDKVQRMTRRLRANHFVSFAE